MLQQVQFFNSGFCKQLSNLVGRRTWRFDRFYAVFVYLEHPRHGAVLIDSGYSPRFFDATRPFPQRLYRWLTPVTLDALGGPANILARNKIDPASIGTVVVSHFHADHIGGLGDFPEAQFIYRADALAELSAQSTREQVRHGFLAALLPPDFRLRGPGIDSASFTEGTDALAGFRTLDLWGDGSLTLVDLPGHAAGHFGCLLQSAEQTVLYIVDATWDVDVLKSGRPLPKASQRFQSSYPAYVQTQERLRHFTASSPALMLACHCPRTQLHVANAEGAVRRALAKRPGE